MAGAIQCVGADLCEELGGAGETSFGLTYEGDPPSRLICQSPSFRVVVDLSPLVVGHLLVVPASHYLSFSQVIAGGHGAELVHFLDRFLPRYRQLFGEPTILEHGSSSDLQTSACITHAHWHVLPLAAANVHGVLLADGLRATELAGFADLAALAGRSYFFCSNAAFSRVYGIDRRMRSQYLRSVAGQLLGIPDPLWDYSVVVRRAYLRETVECARGVFERACS